MPTLAQMQSSQNLPQVPSHIHDCGCRDGVSHGILLSPAQENLFPPESWLPLRDTLPHVTEYTRRQWHTSWAHIKQAEHSHILMLLNKQAGRGWDTCIVPFPFKGDLDVYSDKTQILLCFSSTGVVKMTHPRDLIGNLERSLTFSNVHNQEQVMCSKPWVKNENIRINVKMGL